MCDARSPSARRRTVNVQRFSHDEEIRSPSFGIAAMAERIEIVAPFHRQERLLAIVAWLAGGHDVAADAPPAAAKRNDVVHGERLEAHVAAAVVADPG